MVTLESEKFWWVEAWTRGGNAFQSHSLQKQKCSGIHWTKWHLLNIAIAAWNGSKCLGGAAYTVLCGACIHTIPPTMLQFLIETCKQQLLWRTTKDCFIQDKIFYMGTTFGIGNFTNPMHWSSCVEPQLSCVWIHIGSAQFLVGKQFLYRKITFREVAQGKECSAIHHFLKSVQALVWINLKHA